MTELHSRARGPIGQALSWGSIGALILLAALSAHGIFDLPFMPRISIPPWIFAAFLVAFGTVLMLSLGERMRAGANSSLALAMLPFLAWAGFSSLYSPAPFAVVQTFFVLLFGCGFALYLGSVWTRRQMVVTNHLLFYFSCALTFFLLPAYFYFWVSGDLISGSLNPGIVYLYNRGTLLRFVGLAGNPNFYVLYLTPALFVGFSDTTVRFRKFGLCVLILGLVLAMSFGYFLALGLALLIIRMALGPSHFSILSQIYMHRLRIGAMALVGLVVTTSLLTLGYIDTLLGRFDRGVIGGRDQLIAGGLASLDSPWRGEGLRSLDATVGNFSHNTVVDVLVDMGAIGLILWGLMILLFSLAALRVMPLSSARPWAGAWFVALGHGMTHSLLYNMIFFLAMGGIMAGLRFAKSGEEDLLGG